MVSIQPIFAIAEQFAHSVTSVKPLGNGLINDTYLVITPEYSFVLQKINHRVFPKPELIMANLACLNQHVLQKNELSAKLIIPDLRQTCKGFNFYLDEHNDYWRALSFIDNSESLETPRTFADAQQVGSALGCFHTLMSDLDPELLHDTLPGFHITPSYLSHYQQVINQLQKLPANPDSQYCATFISHFRSIAEDLEVAKQQGLLPTRIIHGDPKLNNFLFDRHSQKIISLIDLDTVKPGLVHYDIGDCLRSCCHNLANDQFDLTLCEAILSSYLSEVGTFFNEYDYHYLYSAIRLIPFELGLRFYTDYLEGNRYFKVTEPEQNCQRAAQQFRLCANIMAQEKAIQALIDR